MEWLFFVVGIIVGGFFGFLIFFVNYYFKSVRHKEIDR